MAPPEAPRHHCHVLLHASGLDFAVAAFDALEVMRCDRPLTEVRRSDRRVLGAVFHRGRSLPVVSLCRWHPIGDIEAEPAEDKPVVCVVRHGARHLGIQVKQLGRVIRSPASAVEEICHHRGTDEIFGSTLSVDGKLWPILDVSALLSTSEVWSAQSSATPAERDLEGDRPACEPMSVFRVGSDWFALPADRTLQAVAQGQVQAIGGDGRLAGAVPWRSHLLPLVRLRVRAPGQEGSGSNLMLVVQGSARGDRVDAAVAVEVDAVDRPHLIARREATSGTPNELDAPIEGPRMQLADGRFVTLLNSDALARQFALAWPSAASRVAAHRSGEDRGVPGSPTGRNAEPYLVFMAGECMAVTLSSVDEVLWPARTARAAEQSAHGTMAWRDELLPVVSWERDKVPPTGPHRGPVVVMRSGQRRQAVQVAAVRCIVPAGAGQLSAFNWRGRGQETLLSAVVDGSRRSFTVWK